ncbi:UVI-1 protein [Colletotrichum orchidophilum]|uniref:UVI-1 protein n=1 Tax=Colletotrichum orchidophilum TaxID=1209926 RepID=A0A1G4BMJ2_9PEZI|nr:UVI-1 protein [Colletotrichum orchidophilum]OHF02680.1 UVI-1 protein [Colletotrichum orchidophilum]
MQFSILKLAVAALAVCSDSVLGQTTPAQVVQNINMVTQKSNALIAPAQKIDIVSGPLIIVGQGPFPQIIAGFVDIVTTVSTALTQMQGMPAVPAGAQSDAIFEAFRDFVRVHQALLNVLIGKAGLFSTVPLIGQPVAAVLRQVENVVDVSLAPHIFLMKSVWLTLMGAFKSVAFALIDAVQSRATDLQAQASMLSGTITTTIDRYQGLSLN